MKYVVMGNFTSLGAKKLAKCEKFCNLNSEPSRKFEVFPLVCKVAMIQVSFSKKIGSRKKMIVVRF